MFSVNVIGIAEEYFAHGSVLFLSNSDSIPLKIDVANYSSALMGFKWEQQRTVCGVIVVISGMSVIEINF